MSLTRAQVEEDIVRRAKGKMSLVGMAITTAGSNNDLNNPLVVAFRACGLTPASQVPTTDADLVNLSDEQIDEFLDRAELRLFENIYGNIDFTDIQVGPRRKALGQLAEQVEKLISQKKEAIYSNYGEGQILSTGSLDLNTAETMCDNESIL